MSASEQPSSLNQGCMTGRYRETATTAMGTEYEFAVQGSSRSLCFGTDRQVSSPLLPDTE